MAFVGKALELISPEKGLESMRPWWDVVSGLIADAMTVISLVSITLQLFGGFGSAVKCTPVLPCMNGNSCVEAGGDVKGLDWSVRMVVDSWCVEKDMRFYAKYLGYILFIQVWLLMAIDNFWLKWSKSASKLRSFIALTEKCSKSKCNHEMVKTQLKRATGDKIETSGYKQGFSSSQLVKIDEHEIQDALVLSDKSMKMVDCEIKSRLLANIYITKTVLKLVVAIVVFIVALFRTIKKDFRFKFDCNVQQLNRHPKPMEGNLTEYYHITNHEHFECVNVVGPFSLYVMIAFLILTLGYIIVSLIALFMFSYIKAPLLEILSTYEETSFKEDMEVKIEKLIKTKLRDVVFLFFFLYTTNKEAFQTFKEFLSPLFHDDLIRLATNRKWNSAEMERRKIPLGPNDDDGFGISLADVDLTSLPACLFSVTKLKELDISFNETLVNLDGIEKLVDLSVLKMESCKLQDFSFVVTLPKLERLEAADNKIAGLPQDFDKLRNLAYLDITNNEGLSELPPVLNTMQTLTELHVESHILDSIDAQREIWSQSKDMENVFKRKASRFPRFF